MNAWDPTPVATVAQFEDGLIRMRVGNWGQISTFDIPFFESPDVRNPGYSSWTAALNATVNPLFSQGMKSLVLGLLDAFLHPGSRTEQGANRG